jgi:hypothetical protein
MNASDLDKLIFEIDRLCKGETDQDLRAELTGIRERIARLRHSPMVSAEARGVITPEARRALGLGTGGVVDQPQTMQAAIQGMASSFKEARLDHDAKKGEVADFLEVLWPGCGFTNKSDAAALLTELEITRRFLIVIKKYLAGLNHDKSNGELTFALKDESTFKEIYYGLLAKARIHESVILRSGLSRNIKTERVYYDTSDRPLIPDLDQRWAKLWEGDNPVLQRLHQHNVYSGDTVDYLQREDQLVLVFYPGDVRERWAFSHKRSKPTASEIEELLGRSGVKISSYRIPEKKKELAEKHKKSRCDALLREMLKIAGPDGVLAPDKQTRDHHALLNRHLSEKIRDARIHVSELLATYERKYTVTEYVGKVKALGKEIPDVARRVTEWNTHHESLIEQVTPLWELADARDKQSDDKYKAALLPALRALITDFPGGTVWDFAYASITAQSDKDGSKYKTALARWRDAYDDDLIATFGAKEAVGLPKDLPIMDLMCMWLFSAHIPKPAKKTKLEAMPVSVFYWLWKQGHFDAPESSDDWILPYEIDWAAFVKALPRDECEQVHDLAIRVWEVEMLEIHECIEWAKGNIEERRTAKWIEHGNEIAQYVAEANGIIAFVDTYEGCYDKMETFINWVLFGQHELGRSKHYEHLAAGSGVVNFKVSISVEASLFSRIGASATLSYQYSGKLTQEDDRRVRWSGTHSFSFGVAADAKLTLSDMVETQLALDMLKASVAADKELYSAVTVSVYESPKHIAAVWAEQLARARYWVTTPVNGINTPGGFQRFRGVPNSQTQTEILEKVVGGKSKLQEITKLLQRPRMRGKRRGLSDYSSDWTLAAEISVPLMQGKAERLAEAKRVMHFSRRKMDERDQPKERYDVNLVTTTWSKNILAFPFLPAVIDSEALGFSWTEVVEDPAANALDLYPEASTEPPTSELLGGFLEADNGSFDVGFTHIADHPNPDNDGMYLNIKSYRNWGAGVRGGDVTFTFQRTQKWMKIDPIKLRWHFNYMVECCRKFFREYVDSGGKLPDLAPGKTIKEDLNDLIIGHLRRHNVQRIKTMSWSEGQPLFHSKPGNSMMSRLRALSLFGAFELNFIYNGASGFEVQYGRIWISNKIVLGFKASVPQFPFLKIGAEIAGELSHACFETLGLHTLSYILTVRNACRKRLDPDDQKAEWTAWKDEHREELHALFNKLADKNSNAYVEVAADSAKSGKIAAKAKALLDLCNVEFDDHIAPVKPPAKAKPRGGKIAVGSSSGAPTVLGGVDFGVTAMALFCHTGWHSSASFYRRGYITHTRVTSRHGKLISRDTNPIFVVRPDNVYDIEFRIEHPKRIKTLELDIFDDKGASVLSKPWTIDATVFEPLFNPSKPSAPEAKAECRGKLRWYGSKDGVLKGGAIAKLANRTLQEGAPLAATPTYYCMVMSVKEATAGPPEGAIAWTYFTVLDDPFAKLDDYLQAAGEAQDAERKPKWKREDKPEEEDEPPALPGRSDAKPEPPKIEPPKASPVKRDALVEPAHQRRVAKLVIGIENLGSVEGYTCYLNSALQLILQCRLLPTSRHTAKLDKPALAKDVFDFATLYEAQRGTGVDFVPKSQLQKLRDIRTKLHAGGIITQIEAEDDADAVLFGMLDACSTTERGQSPSKLHFNLRVMKTYNPGVGRDFASSEEAVRLMGKFAELSKDNTTTEIQRHNGVRIDGIPVSDVAQPLQTLWNASWDADVSGDNTSSKFKGDKFYETAQPLRQTIAFEGPPSNPLLISLKRFHFNSLTRQTTKISTPVDVGTELTVRGQKYRLVGFIEHIGARFSTGHYVVYLRRNGEWYRCSDDSVQACSARRLDEKRLNGYVYCFRQIE